MDFPKIDGLKAAARSAIKKDDNIRAEIVAEYDAISDNIETAGNKDILAFSVDKDIDTKLRELNKCIVLNTSFGLDWLCEMIKREEPFLSAKMLAYLHRSETMTIKTNDSNMSDFIYAFMRMNNLQSRIDGAIYNRVLIEFSPKGIVAEIGVPIGYIKNIHLIADSFAYFLDSAQGFYLLDKMIYTDKYQWEKELEFLVKNMISHLTVGSLEISPQGFLETVLKRSDRRRSNEIEPIVREELRDVEDRKRVQERREQVATTVERKQAMLREKNQEETKQPAVLRRRTIFDKYSTVHKRRKIGEEWYARQN